MAWTKEEAIKAGQKGRESLTRMPCGKFEPIDLLKHENDLFGSCGINKLCSSCSESCKQHNKVEIVVCPSYNVSKEYKNGVVVERKWTSSKQYTLECILCKHEVINKRKPKENRKNPRICPKCKTGHLRMKQ